MSLAILLISMSTASNAAVGPQAESPLFSLSEEDGVVVAVVQAATTPEATVGEMQQ